MVQPQPDLVHVWNRCGACGQRPIIGPRFECQTCPIGPDNDLCENCHKALRSSSSDPAGRLAGERHPAGPGGAVHIFREVQGKPRILYLPWLAIPDVDTTAPCFPDRFVVRPEFRSGLDSFLGAYAFAIRAGPAGGALVLTALHVLDELIKAKGVCCGADQPAYTGWKLPTLVESVQLYDVCAANWMLAELGSAHAMLHLPEARTGEEEPYAQRDIAAFHLPAGGKFSPAPLAAAPPAVGTPIWLMVSSPNRGGRNAIRAVVVEQTDRALIFRYTARVSLPPYCSGAPLVNRLGEVVGIKIGAGFFEGHVLGHALHVTSIRRHLGMLPN